LLFLHPRLQGALFPLLHGTECQRSKIDGVMIKVAGPRALHTLCNVCLSCFVTFDLLVQFLLFLYINACQPRCNNVSTIPLLSAIDFANSFLCWRTRCRWICVHLSKCEVKRFIFALRSSKAKLMGAKEAMDTGAVSAIFAIAWLTFL
jgi:hypothetical protein